MQTMNDLDIENSSNREAIQGFFVFLDTASKIDLDESIRAVSEVSKDMRQSPHERRLAKNVLAVLRKERREFLK